MKSGEGLKEIWRAETQGKRRDEKSVNRRNEFIIV